MKSVISLVHEECNAPVAHEECNTPGPPSSRAGSVCVCVEPAQGGVGGGGGVSAEVTLLSLTFVRTTVATSGSWQREVGLTHAEGPA